MLKRLPARLGLFLISTLVALALGEAWLAAAGIGQPGEGSALRLMGRSATSIAVPDDDLLVRLEPGSSFLGSYHINERGWRGGPVRGTLPDGTLRIVAVGDSCTFGYGLDEPSSWPARLQTMLDLAFEDALAFDVVNTGVPGYSTWQNRLQVERQIAELEPDLVVLMTSGHNDVTGVWRFSDSEQAAYNRSVRRRIEASRLVRAMRAATGTELRTPRQVIPPGLRGVPWRVTPHETRRNLTRMAAAVEAAGARMLVVLPSHSRFSLEAVPAYGQIADLLDRVARELDVPSVDMRPVAAAWEPADLFIDPVHPDERGAAEIAWLVFDWLVRDDASVVPEGPRRAWLSAWLEARAGERHDLDWLLERHGPPRIESARFTLRRIGATEEPFLAEPPGVSRELLRLDPLFGVERWHHVPGLLTLMGRTTLAAGGQQRGQNLLRRAGLVREARIPRVSQGIEAMAFGPDPGHVADARALLLLEALLRGAARPTDKRYDLAEQAHESGQDEKALTNLDGMLGLTPHDVSALLLRGQVLRRLGRFEEAEACFARVVELDPTTHEAMTLLAMADYRAGRLEQAEQRLDTVVRGSPDYAPARYLRCRVYKDTERPLAAWRELAATRAFSDPGQFPDIGELARELQAARPDRLGHGRNVDG